MARTKRGTKACHRNPETAKRELSLSLCVVDAKKRQKSLE